MMYVELTSILGHRQVVPLAVYLEWPSSYLNGTRARLMTRVEAVRALHRAAMGGV